MKIIPELNKFLPDVEKGFNICGALPFISVPSGAVRVAFGVAQMAIGAGVAVACTARRFMKEKIHHHDWKKLSTAGLEHIIHGALNIIRGLGEMVVGILSLMYTYGAANCLMIPLNLNTAFEPKVQYGFLTDPNGMANKPVVDNPSIIPT